jgi:4-cresol dehydrogenase (hydroxylating)
MTSAADSALRCFADAVGAAHVVTDRPALEAAGTATFAWSQRVLAVVRPGDRREVQECVRIANRYRVTLYPVSSGRNWGFGSSVPTTDGAVLLHLGRMNRILELNETLAYATIEPGVTQGQLFEHLREHHPGLWIDATASSPDCSLVGNVMERGIGFTPYADHVAQVCALEVVLPTGQCIETGFAHIPGAKAARVFSSGVGPQLDGLFIQSGFGIVTRLTLWLMPAPRRFLACYFNLAKDGDLEPMVDAIRVLRLHGTLRSPVNLYNDCSVLSSICQYPWGEAAGTTPLPGEVLDAMKRTWDMGAWHGSLGLYGTDTEVRQRRRLIRRSFRPLVRRLNFLDDRKIRLARLLDAPYRTVRGVSPVALLEHTMPGYGLLKGIPTDQALSSAYWRKKERPPPAMDPGRDRCGQIWCTPISPLEGRHLRSVVGIATRVLPAYGFEPIISMRIVTERAVHCTVAVAYDRDVTGQDESALLCYAELLARLAESGYYPYRIGVQSMPPLHGAEGDRACFLRTLKQTVDPNNILAPGRYL